MTRLTLLIIGCGLGMIYSIVMMTISYNQDNKNAFTGWLTAFIYQTLTICNFTYDLIYRI